MKLKIITILTLTACVACSEEGVQFDLEKAKSIAPETVRQPSDRDEATQEQQQQNKAAIVSLQQELTQDSSKEPENDISIDLDTSALSDAEMMRELEESLAKVDDEKLMAAGATKDSVNDLRFETLSLMSGSTALTASNKSLVSNVKSVAGATSIVGDEDGFGFTIDLSGDYLFEFDKDTLTPEAKVALESVFALYKEYQGTTIKISGHTDSKGSNEYNLDLSKRRAKSVKKWFEAVGIASTLMTTTGYGELQPVADNEKDGQDYPEGRALNRRVEISAKTKKKVNNLPALPK